jgi:hypothetical protein
VGCSSDGLFFLFDKGLRKFNLFPIDDLYQTKGVIYGAEMVCSHDSPVAAF